MESVIGLVMTGGGAGRLSGRCFETRGEIQRIEASGNPFPLIGGASAGAVNGAALAAGCDEFGPALAFSRKMWAALKPSDVFHCDLYRRPEFPDLDSGSLFWRIAGGGMPIFIGCDSRFCGTFSAGIWTATHPGKHQARQPLRAGHLGDEF